MLIFNLITAGVFDDFYQNILDTSFLEFVAVIFGLLSVWYARKENIWVYPTGIVNVLIFVYICYYAKLYADMGINFFYFIMSVYGWYNWARKDANKKVVPISSCTPLWQLVNVLAVVGFYLILSYVLSHYTDSNVPQWDAFTTSFFIVAMWLMARKKIENWIAWIIGDVISIPLYVYKGLVFSGFQYFVFLILAIAGYIEWRKKLKHES